VVTEVQSLQELGACVSVMCWVPPACDPPILAIWDVGRWLQSRNPTQFSLLEMGHLS
jgi:hypothetical protein